MSILSKFFHPEQNRPFVEFPDGHLKRSAEAVVAGIKFYRNHGNARPALISWQGQGSHIDAYHIVDARLEGDYVRFNDDGIDLEKVCVDEGVSYDALRGRTPTELNVGSLSDMELARFLQSVFTKHLGIRPFSDTGDYCIGFEYERRT